MGSFLNLPAPREFMPRSSTVWTLNDLLGQQELGQFNYLPPGSPEGDHNLHHVRVYVRACVTQFSLKLLQLHIFGKSQVLMNFFALQYFWGLVNFGLLLSE